MAEKDPCRYLGDDWFCAHPLMLHYNAKDGCGDVCAECEGCPCHEPQGLVFRSAEEVFKHYGVTLADDGHEPFEPQPDPTPDTCRWWKDEYGNWCCSCSDTLPDFTPWTGTDPNGCFCPNCGKIITVRVHDKP